MNSNGVKVTRVLNGWYVIGGCLTGVEVIKDGLLWEVRKDGVTVSQAETFDSAKAFAFGLVA